MSKWLIVILEIAILIPNWAFAYDNRCGYYPKGDTRAICKGRSLPYEQTRGRSNSRLTCGGSVDHFIRKPQEIPGYEKWADFIKSEGARSENAYNLRTNVPDIKWSGRIPYTVVEEWNWIECTLGTSSYHCGTHEECHNESYTTQSCDSQNRCKTNYHTRRVCTQVANTCYYDVNRSASMACSTESMTFNAEFIRDPNYNNKSENYNEFIPNKYDLLPGEVEDVQIFSTTSRGTRINPKAVVGDEWNNYKFQLSGSAVGASCQQNASEHLNVAIHTVNRKIKSSPNAFQLPVDFEGNPLSPLQWMISDSFTKGDSYIKTKPREVRLSDASAAIVGLMARQSRDVADREIKKQELGLGETNDQAKKDAKSFQSFFKNTTLRMHLVEDSWGWTTSFGAQATVMDADAITSANLSLSKLQSIRTSEYWVVPLEDDSIGINIYKRDKWLPRLLGMGTREMKPSQRYLLRMSMYQKGVPFYYQLCNNKGQANCTTKESLVYSKPMDIPFWTHPQYDNRPFWQRLNEFAMVDWLHRKWRSRNVPEDNADYSTTKPFIPRGN